jgi:hypothetical protein
VRVAEGTWGLQRLTHTLECEVGLTAPGVQYTAKRVEHGLVRQLFQSRRQPLLDELKVSAQQRSEDASGARIDASGAFPEPGLRCLFRAREVAAIDIKVLEVAGSSPWVRPQRHSWASRDS